MRHNRQFAFSRQRSTTNRLHCELNVTRKMWLECDTIDNSHSIDHVRQVVVEFTVSCMRNEKCELNPNRPFMFSWATFDKNTFNRQIIDNNLTVHYLSIRQEYKKTANCCPLFVYQMYSCRMLFIKTWMVYWDVSWMCVDNKLTDNGQQYVYTWKIMDNNLLSTHTQETAQRMCDAHRTSECVWGYACVHVCVCVFFVYVFVCVWVWVCGCTTKKGI